jgi:hypothetical protein
MSHFKLLFFTALKLENTKLHEQIVEFKFVLDQNATIIQRLKKDNDSKSVLILQLQNGKGKSMFSIIPT